MLLNCGVGGDSWVPWTARRSNQSIFKEINSEYSLEGLMLKLKLQYLATWGKEPTHWKRPRCWKRLRAGWEEDNRGWDGCMASLIQRKWVWTNCGGYWRTRKLGMLQSTGSQRVGQELANEQQQYQCNNKMVSYLYVVSWRGICWKMIMLVMICMSLNIMI